MDQHEGFGFGFSHGFGAKKGIFIIPNGESSILMALRTIFFLQFLGIGLSILRHWSNLSMIPIPVVLLFLKGATTTTLENFVTSELCIWQFGAVQERSVEKARVVFAQLLLTLTKFTNPQLKRMIFDKVLKKWRDI